MQIKMNYLKKLATWLLPHSCILCGRHANREQDLCESCFRDLPILIYACQRCAKPMELIRQTNVCVNCIHYPPPFDRTYALYFYDFPITRLIMDLKFGQALVNARILGELLVDKILTIWYRNKPLPEVIIPIPLHAQRLKTRGYNQALEIARPIGKKLSIPIDAKRSSRIINTSAQATLPAKERQLNIKNAFQIAQPLAYQHVAVIDDVITTGHTMTEFCKTLKLAGVKTIDVWCCARPACDSDL